MQRCDRSFDVEADDRGAAREQGSTHALPMPDAAPVTSATSPANSGRLAGFAQLGLLEVPVLDVEDVALRQRRVAAQQLARSMTSIVCV